MDNYKTPATMQAEANPPTNEVTPNLLRRVNERRILEAIQSKGSLSRAGLVRQTGISPPTVSKLVRSLIAARLLEEGEVLAPAPGRPARVLHLAQAGVRVLGAVVDVKECCIAATGLDGRLRDGNTHRFPTPDSYPALIDAIVKHARRLTPRGEKAGTLALGVSVPGLIDRRQQQCLLSANLHMLETHFLASDLQKRLGVQTILLHDTDALCLGERAFGQARGIDDFVFVDATGGLGAAVMNDGRLMPGHNGLAGEIGHITVEPTGRRCGCGNVGCLETLATDVALAERISDKLGHTVDIDQVVEMMRSKKSNGKLALDRPAAEKPVGEDSANGIGQGKLSESVSDAAGSHADGSQLAGSQANSGAQAPERRGSEPLEFDRAAVETEIKRNVEYLGIAIAAVVNIFNPEAIFVRSRMLDIREGLFESLLEQIGRRALGPLLSECKILRASETKLHGAIAGTIHHLTSVLGPKM